MECISYGDELWSAFHMVYVHFVCMAFVPYEMHIHKKCECCTYSTLYTCHVTHITCTQCTACALYVTAIVCVMCTVCKRIRVCKTLMCTLCTRIRVCKMCTLRVLDVNVIFAFYVYVPMCTICKRVRVCADCVFYVYSM